MSLKSLLLFLFFISTTLSITAQEKGDLLFSSQMHEIRLYSHAGNDLYSDLENDIINEVKPYRMAHAQIDGVQVDSIGVRTKGFFSQEGEYVPMKIDFNHYLQDLEYDGLKKINLNTNFMDETMQREFLCYSLFRRAGIAAPRVAFVEVYVDDVFISLYTIVEQIDKTFIQENFASNDGSLMKSTGFEDGAQVQFGPVNTEMQYIIDDNVDGYESFVALKEYYSFLLIDIIVGAGDNWAFGYHNFYAYYDPVGDQLQFIPWDHDLSLAISFFYLIAGSIYPHGISFEIQSQPEFFNAFIAQACALKEYLLDEDYIEQLIENNNQILASNSQGITVASGNEYIEYFADRIQDLDDYIISEGATCSPLNYELEDGDLVINEFASTSDTNGNVFDENGEVEDWIELFNNSNDTIHLNHQYYISDDIDFPKKWRFKSDHDLPPNSFFILWADRDLDQTGVHTNFKIDKDQGDLILSFEDLTVIDQVSYDQQTLNLSYARIPNGTGDFTQQTFTFGSINDEVTTIESGLSNDFTVFPNPCTHSLTISSLNNQSVECKIELLDLNGKTIDAFELLISNQFQIDMTDYNPGLYFLRISSQDHSSMHKILVMGA